MKFYDVFKIQNRLIKEGVHEKLRKGNIFSLKVHLRNKLCNKTFRTDRKIVQKSIENPKLYATEIRAEVEVFEVSFRTIQRRLEDAELHERISAKKPFIFKKCKA